MAIKRPDMNPLVQRLTNDNGEPIEAVVLQGYLSSPEIVTILAEVAQEAKGKRGIGATCVSAVVALIRARTGPDSARIYLSAKMDRWVDFDWDNDVLHVVPEDGRGHQTRDFTTTVWLKVPREREGREPRHRQYRLMTRTVLAPDEGFTRGKLVEDFMADPQARAVWDEQGYAPLTGAKSRMYCT